jgi:putative endonuclease
MLGRFFDWLRHRSRLRKWTSDQALGRRGEDLAHRFLRKQGYTIVARNYRLGSGNGEADLIAWEKERLVIVEVKSRRSAEFGPPERAIDDEKRRSLMRVARDYARKSEVPLEQVRFDLVSVVFSEPPEIQLFRGAWSDTTLGR